MTLGPTPTQWRVLGYLRQFHAEEDRLPTMDEIARQWQHGYASRLPGPAYCVAIEKATAGAVTRQELRPGDWRLIWPELITDASTQEAA